MMKVPVGGGLAPLVQGPVSIQLPSTTPLLRVPVVVVVPLDVPVKPFGLLVSVRTLPDGVIEVTV